jgi:hypothetical protein
MAGTLGSVRIVTDQFTGRSRGFGFVEMATREETVGDQDVERAPLPRPPSGRGRSAASASAEPWWCPPDVDSGYRGPARRSSVRSWARWRLPVRQGRHHVRRLGRGSVPGELPLLFWRPPHGRSPRGAPSDLVAAGWRRPHRGANRALLVVAPLVRARVGLSWLVDVRTKCPSSH